MKKDFIKRKRIMYSIGISIIAIGFFMLLSMLYYFAGSINNNSLNILIQKAIQNLIMAIILIIIGAILMKLSSKYVKIQNDEEDDELNKALTHEIDETSGIYVCIKCGSINDIDSIYCKKCGRKLIK